VHCPFPAFDPHSSHISPNRWSETKNETDSGNLGANQGRFKDVTVLAKYGGFGSLDNPGGAHSLPATFSQKTEENAMNSLTLSTIPRAGTPKCRVLTSIVATLLLALTIPAQLAAQTAAALKYTVLYAFTGAADGAIPFSAVVQDDQGNLYGTTQWAGNLSDCVSSLGTGCGVVFKLSPNGTQTVLHAFTGGADGAQPKGTLLLDPNGNLYGTTFYGGDVNCLFTGSGGCGVVFKIDSQGTFSVLHTFEGTDGEASNSGLVRDSAGNLYGSTSAGGGGGGSGCGSGCGEVFKLDPNGNLTILHSFTGQPDGVGPSATPTLGTDGKIYSTTARGGTLNQGTVFQLSPNQDGTWTESILHSFNGTDGSQIFAGVVRDDNGNLYGAAAGGGTGGSGVVFKIDANGNESTFYNFTGGAAGGTPYGDLIRDPHGNLYGTTFFSDQFPGGVVFRLDPTGTETVLHDFTVLANGAAPYAGLFRDRNGNLYGTTGYGGDVGSQQAWCGAHGCGVVFKISACHTALCQGGGN
jgi:uncharacterized repeat protein (TIGR03803 family)